MAVRVPLWRDLCPWPELPKAGRRHWLAGKIRTRV
jgi:hypothetical protein